MPYSKQQLWERFQKYYSYHPSLGLALDLSRLDLPDDYFASLAPRMQKAFSAMADLERRATANPDENRLLGHYWLRNPALAPTPQIRRDIEQTLASIKSFASQVHTGKVQGRKRPFRNVLLIGIGGSALGPQFVARALGQTGTDKLSIYFLDKHRPRWI